MACCYSLIGVVEQAWVKILTLAFLVVAGSCGLLIPIMLYVLDLRSDGWTWQYVALFGSMCASTDAVAIVATMKTSEYISSQSFPSSQARVWSLDAMGCISGGVSFCLLSS